MKRVWTLLLACMLLGAAALADGSYALQDTASGGTFWAEEQYGREVVIRGEYGDCTLDAEGEGWGYRFQKDGQTARLHIDHLTVCPDSPDAATQYSPLIGGALPESIDDVTRINRAMTLLPDGMYFSVPLSGAGKGTLPVYTAPDAGAYRAAGGKAAIGLDGEMLVLDWRGGYMMVFYETGSSSRVGWVKEHEALARAMADKGHKEDTFLNGIHRWGRMPATAARQTEMTDAPDLNGETLAALEAGEEITCLGRWGSLLAYAETTLGGKTVRGFVPLKDVDIPEPPADHLAMEALAGTSWVFYAGGSMFADFQHFRSDGVIVGGYALEGGGLPDGQDGELHADMIGQWKTREYTVCRYDPAWGLYWADVPYMMTLQGEDGYVSRYGLDFGADFFNLFTSEGSGGCIPYTGSLDAVPPELLAPQAKPFTDLAQLDDSVTAGYEVLDSDVHDYEIALLLQDEDGAQALRFIWRREDGSIAFSTLDAIPRGGSLDTAHAKDGMFLYRFVSDTGTAATIAFERNAWNVWYPSQVVGEELYGLSHHALIDLSEPVLGRNDGYHYGVHPWADWTSDLTALPDTLGEALLQLDDTGFAVVSNPDPADRLHLRVGPDRGSASLGKFYNRTPVIIEREQGDWAEVIVGSNLKGYMMKKYLSFEGDMDAVTCAFPQLHPSSGGVMVYASPDASGKALFYAGSEDFIVGVHTDAMGGEWYLVLSQDGLFCGYARKQDYEAGNG